jgi:hypothetical protein
MIMNVVYRIRANIDIIFIERGLKTIYLQLLLLNTKIQIFLFCIKIIQELCEILTAYSKAFLLQATFDKKRPYNL